MSWLNFPAILAVILFPCRPRAAQVGKVFEIQLNQATNPVAWLAFQSSLNYTQILPNQQVLNSDGLSFNNLNWFSVTVGGFHACAIRRYMDSSTSRSGNSMDSSRPTDAPGILLCWGKSSYGQTNVVPPFGRPTQQCTSSQFCWDLDDGWRNLSAGWLHTCGILANGRLSCWGNNRHNELGDPDLLEPGKLTCTGASGRDNCNAQLRGRWALTPFGAVSAGRWHTCAIRCPSQDPALDHFDRWALENSTGWGGTTPSTCSQGEVVCWGDDRMRQGGSGLRAKGLAQHTDYVSVCAAAAHSCAVRSGGQLYCWGHNGNNRVVLPDTYSGFKWQGGAHTCALARPDSIGHSALACWGHNGHGQTAVPKYRQTVPVPQNGSTVPLVDVFIIDRSFVAFDAGEHASCALWQQTRADMTCNNAASKPPALNGECWGDGSYGQNALPSRRVGHQLKDICRILQWKIVATGAYHTCGISIDDVGSLCQTDGTCDEYPAPLGRQPEGAITPCARGVYGAGATVRRADGRVVPCVPVRTNQMRCWGLDTDGQLNIPGAAASPRPCAAAAAFVAAIVLAATSVHTSHSRSG